MLEIRDLHATVNGKEILKGLTLSVGTGEVHAIMGPNGAGKSTLAYVLAGRDGYEVTAGDCLVDGRSLLALAPEDRALAGLFLAFQYPVEIPGVANSTFLREALNAQRRGRGEPDLDALQFVKLARQKMKSLGMTDEMLKRQVNVGFSGGEKKRNEVLQLAILEPKVAVMDETDSGLDVDALRTVARAVNALRAPDRSFLMITHYERLLEEIVPDRVHILAGGRIVGSGGPELAREIEHTGYAAYAAAAA
ncbi:MAG: Fe-S cluster assembly ATPase SufC [Defluviicoccus sp.]